MDVFSPAASALSLLAGIGTFLIACKMMSENLESIGSDKLRALFASASRSKLLGVGIGALGTAAIQSSGATTVMVIGFVNAGIMTLVQAATIVFGANIGTTITAHIVALGLIGADALSTTAIFSAFTCIGALLAQKAKGDNLRTIGGIVTGFGMLFVGLSKMSSSMEGFAQLEGVRTFLASIENGALLILTGAILTAIIQSSSVMTSVAITMLVAGLITLDQGIFLTMGSNIGSCVVSIIASITSGTNAKRTAAIHLLFNIGGVVLFVLIGLAIRLFTGGAVSLGSIFYDAFPGMPQTQLAVFHTVFNVVAVIVVLPFTEAVVALVCRIIPDSDQADAMAYRTHFIDENMLATPAIAVAQVRSEIANMAVIATENFDASLSMATSMDFSGRRLFYEREGELDFLNRAIVVFIAKLLKGKLSEADHTYLSKAIHSVSDFERVGDYAKNIVEYAEALDEIGQCFSPVEIEEIERIGALIHEISQHTVEAYLYGEHSELEQVYALEEQVNALAEQMAQSYIRRLADGSSKAEESTRFLSLSTDAERVADHFVNVAKTVRTLA